MIVPGNVQNAKSYPHWDRFLELAQGHEVKKIEGMLKEREIIDLVNWCDVWVSTDSFLPHLVAYRKLKPGVVIWGKSDPEIFGYPTNVNLLKGREHLMVNQFRKWSEESHDPGVFVSPEVVIQMVEKITQTT